MRSAPKFLSLLAITIFLTCLSSRTAFAQTASVSCSPCSGPQGTVVQVNLSGYGGLPVGVVAATDPGGGGSESYESGCTPNGSGACTAQVVMPGATLNAETIC